MKRLIYKIFISLFTIFFLFVTYFSIIGFETDKFNDQIKNKVSKVNQNLKIDLKKIKLILNPFNFKINVKTFGPKLTLKSSEIEIQSVETSISLKSLINNQFSLTNLSISTKSVEIKKLTSFVRSLSRNTKLLILENFIKEGYLIADIELEFDEKGNIKDNYNINGFIRDTKIDFLKKHKIDKLNLIFDINRKETNLKKIKLSYNKKDLFFKKISIRNNKKDFLINGELDSENLLLEDDFISQFLNYENIKIKSVDFNSKSKFSFKIDKKFKIKDFKFQSIGKINELIISSKHRYTELFPESKTELNFKNNNIEINYNKGEMNIVGDGKVLIQNFEDNIRYKINKNKKNLRFDTSIEIKDNPLLIDFLSFEKKEKNLIKINLKGKIDENETKIENFLLKDDENKIEFRNISFDKNLKIKSFLNAQFNFFDIENIKNEFVILNDNKNYILKGKLFNANKLITNLLDTNKDSQLLFKNKFILKVKLDEFRLDEEFTVRNFKGNLKFNGDDFSDVNLVGFFENNKKIKITVKSINNEKITTMYSDYAKPFVKRYKFIKGFDNGSIDYHSSKINKKTFSTIKIYDFKLNELPALTKLLTLASLQGIADLLTGEGIRFNEFEMNFNSENSLMTIDEIYAIGPAISILMNGYIEKNELISLRGTLVPATTLNKVIGSIPFLGNILVGSKTGEGVFGVSFKIKGPPKKLDTTVNPIKTLTPRFITRTLEKIKKTN